MAEKDAAGTGNAGNPSGATYPTAAAAADALVAMREAESDSPEASGSPDPEPQAETSQEAQAPSEALPDLDGGGQEPDPDPDPVAEPDGEDDSIDYGELVNGTSDFDDAGEGEETGAEFTLQYAGQERRVSRSEAIDLAQKGLDYDTKMQTVAEDRRAGQQARSEAEAERDALRKEREDLAKRLSAYVDKLDPPDPALAESDPDAYTAAKAKYDAAMAQAAIDAKELDEQREKDAQDRQARINTAMDAHMQRLQQRIPDMKNEKIANEVGKYLTQGIGFTRDDLFTFQRIHPADSRFLEIAYKARKWDLAQAKQKRLRPKADKVTGKGSAGRAGGAKPSKAGEAVARLKKTGKIDDAVEALRAARSS